MSRVGMVFLLGAALVLWLGLPVASHAQDFPYAVPQAPEFDTGDGMAPPASVEESPPTPGSEPSSPRRGRSSKQPKPDYRAVRPYVPQETAPSVAGPQIPHAPEMPAPQARPPRMQPPQMGNPAVASTPPGPPPQMAPRLDCSKFPMLIAQAKSDEEMQWTARLYLTCLVRSGWSEEQAKQQVINTIESTYRLAR